MIEQVQAATNKAILNEIHDLLDCLHVDGSIVGLEEINPTSTLGCVLRDFMVSSISMSRSLEEIREVWAGAEAGEPVHAQEAYAINLCKQMYQISVEAIKKTKYVLPLTHRGGYPPKIEAVETVDEAAFPSVSYSQEIGDETFYESEPGLTIRDYFAIHGDADTVEAISGSDAASASKFLGLADGTKYVASEHWPAANAKARYILADAMMKARACS